MLECLEFRDEKNALETGLDGVAGDTGRSHQYGKFSFSRLEKGQGLTVANTLRRVLLYELPAVGITSVFIRTSSGGVGFSPTGDRRQSLQPGLEEVASSSSAFGPPELEGASPPNAGTERLDIGTKSTTPVVGLSAGAEIALLSDVASSHHEFSTLPGVKESVLEILLNLKSVVFENIFAYSSMQKGSLSLKRDETTLNQDVERSPQSSETPFFEYKVRASQLVLPSEIRVIHPDQVLATLINRPKAASSTDPETTFELEFTIEKITQSDLTSTSSFSGRAPNRSTRNRRILPIDGTVFPVKKVNYTIEQDSFGKESIFFEVWTNGGLHPRDAMFQSIEKVIKLFQTFQE
jgi:DNA-directed RNA polymerase alpha subunit